MSILMWLVLLVVRLLAVFVWLLPVPVFLLGLRMAAVVMVFVLVSLWVS